MSSKMVISNLRIPEADWLQLRAMAAEAGMSANEFVTNLLKVKANARILGVVDKRKTSMEKILTEFARKRASAKGKDLSGDDETVYGG